MNQENNQLHPHWPRYVFHCFSTEAGEEITASPSAPSHSHFRLLIWPFCLNLLEPLRQADQVCFKVQPIKQSSPLFNVHCMTNKHLKDLTCGQICPFDFFERHSHNSAWFLFNNDNLYCFFKNGVYYHLDQDSHFLGTIGIKWPEFPPYIKYRSWFCI